MSEAKYTQADMDEAVKKAEERTLDIVLRLMTDENFSHVCDLLASLPKDQFNSVKELMKFLK